MYKVWHANECQCLFPTTSFQSMWKVNGVGVLGHLNVASLNKQTKIGKSKSEREKKIRKVVCMYGLLLLGSP